MIWARKACVAFFLGGIFSTLGCCYHAQHFGRTRDIGVCEIGCDTCKSSCTSGSTHCTRVGSKETGTATAKNTASGSGTVQASHQEPRKGLMGLIRDSLERKAAKASPELPVYVLPTECVTNGVIVSPHTVPMPIPTALTREPIPEVPVRDAPAPKEEQ